jgi:adenine-specific DNA methylase
MMGNYTAEVQPRGRSRGRDEGFQQLELLFNGASREERQDGTSALGGGHPASRSGRPARGGNRDHEVLTVSLADPCELSSILGTETSSPFRPIQYLGNKQRSLGAILSAVREVARPNQSAVDLFTGTSVVAQGMAGLGLNVHALDVSPASTTIAQATLGVRRQAANPDIDELLGRLGEAGEPVGARLCEAFAAPLERERHCLDLQDGAGLIDLSRELPQVWRGSADGALANLFSTWSAAAAEGAPFDALVSPVFAGTYFGVHQAIALDVRRTAIGVLAQRGEIDQWETALLLTGLLAAASVAAFSPGKHFAQPHRLDPAKDLSFHRQRALADRAVDVGAVMAHTIRQIVEAGRAGNEGHQVHRGHVESLTSDWLVRRNIGVVYADPPYTAQQYSRFYHVLDTIAAGRCRPLQQHRGGTTTGLYPEGRYKSPFCSKLQAPAAFQHLADLCAHAGATLLLSYSSSAKLSVGNERMISLPDLHDLVSRSFGNSQVEVLQLHHSYRQFNHTDAASPTRSDPEMLVIAHAP